MVEKVKNKYVFPNILASFMSKVDMRTQYEASMLSMSFILFGVITSVVYMGIYVHSFPLWYKIFLMLNGVAGFIFISSFLVTTFQQYQTYMLALEFQNKLKGGKDNGKD